MTLISQKEGELNAARAALAATEAKALVDVATAPAEGRAATDAEVAVVQADAGEAVTAPRAEAQKIAKDEFKEGFI